MVSLDRYIDDEGLNIAREEVELITGMALLYVLRWTNSETLTKRCASSTIKHLTLVVVSK
jgi:hypothetical protein